MKYKKVIEGEFVYRHNRFIADVKVNGAIEKVHVKNTGRCKELLIPGATVYLSVIDNPSRKTKYDLIAVRKKNEASEILINMDSQIPNDVAFEWLPESGIFSKDSNIRREVKFGNSRFDLLVEDENRKAFVEIKGVTLEKEGIALFPDAPTERGVKHVRELVSALEDGYEAYILFVVQMKGVHSFSPNRLMHPEFAEALEFARDRGVQILAVDCNVAESSIQIHSEIPVLI